VGTARVSKKPKKAAKKRSGQKARALPQRAPVGTIVLRLFDGARRPLEDGRQYLVRILDGSQRQLLARDFSRPAMEFEVPVNDNLDDRYTVLVSASHSRDAGFYPIIVKRDVRIPVDLMLIPKPHAFDFGEADWDQIKGDWPAAYRALAFGVPESDARARYDALLGAPLPAAALWNIMTTMRDVQLPQGSPLDYLREVVWDGELAPSGDRFFAFADARLIEQVELAHQQGTFEPEPNPGLFHAGATRSFKHVAFGEANLQLTFHEGTTKNVAGETWVRVEPDIDYYKDVLAHALLEVLPHQLGGPKTDPAIVYVLRWIAGRHAGVAEFAPPFSLVEGN
jgi:hypothetical protein